MFTLQSESKNSDELPALDVVNGKLWPCTLAEIQKKKKPKCKSVKSDVLLRTGFFAALCTIDIGIPSLKERE